MAGESRQQAALRRLYDLAKREIADALKLVDPGDAAAVADVIYTYVPVIAERYGLAAGALAADWYDDAREAAEVAGYFRASPAPLPDAGRYQALAGWAASKDDVESLVVGGVQRIIANAHRETVMGSAFADPRAEGWARFSGGGDGSCPFCFMLISRGAVYTDRTVKFGSHDHCNCGAGPIFKGQVRQVDAYKKSTRRRSGGTTSTDNARARDWIAENL